MIGQLAVGIFAIIWGIIGSLRHKFVISHRDLYRSVRYYKTYKGIIATLLNTLSIVLGIYLLYCYLNNIGETGITYLIFAVIFIILLSLIHEVVEK